MAVRAVRPLAGGRGASRETSLTQRVGGHIALRLLPGCDGGTPDVPRGTRDGGRDAQCH